MKAWLFTLGFGAALFPAIANAGAAPEPRDCQTGNARRGECIASSTQPLAPQIAIVSRQSARESAPQIVRNDGQRRRSGKHIPDAELIGPRGAL